jgi:hypothetical protein
MEWNKIVGFEQASPLVKRSEWRGRQRRTYCSVVDAKFFEDITLAQENKEI